MNDRLYRSRDDRVVGGVCAGLADRFDLDPSLVRVLWAVLTLFSGLFPGVVIYILMLIIVPEEPAELGSTAPPAWPGATGTQAAPPADEPTTGTTAATGAAPGDASASGTAWATDPASSPGAADTGWIPPAQAYADRRSQRAARRAARRGRNDGAIALVFGVLLILVGAWFLLRPYLPAFDWDLVWPIAIIGLGVALLVGALSRRSPDDGA